MLTNSMPFERAMRVLLAPHATQYMVSVTNARGDGMLKYVHQKAMTDMYIATVLGCDPPDHAMNDFHSDWYKVCDATRPLRHNLEHTVGFDPAAPVTEAMTRKFLTAFHRAAVSSLGLPPPDALVLCLDAKSKWIPHGDYVLRFDSKPFERAMAQLLTLNASHYLLSCTVKQSDTIFKFVNHGALCDMYVMAKEPGCPLPSRAKYDFADKWHAVHDGTQYLTDHLDAEIGFNPAGAVSETMVTRFLAAFHRTAVAILNLPAPDAVLTHLRGTHEMN